MSKLITTPSMAPNATLWITQEEYNVWKAYNLDDRRVVLSNLQRCWRLTERCLITLATSIAIGHIIAVFFGLYQQ